MAKDLFIEHLESMDKSCSQSSCIKETEKKQKKLKEITEKGDDYILMPCWPSFGVSLVITFWNLTGDRLLESHW